jgi:hypothetical protein
LGGSVHAIKKNTEALVVATKEIGLEVNAETTNYVVVMSRNQNAGQNSQDTVMIGGKTGQAMARKRVEEP